jgi:hypothetical protein
MTRGSCLTLLLALAVAPPAVSQSPTPAAMDSLLERMVGRWIMSGSVLGKPVSYVLDVSRVLQRRFVELHMTDRANPPQYEARVFIGVDSAGGRYLAHWLDNTGAAYSIPPATGTASGDTVNLMFPYPDGAFRDTFAYDRQAGTWHFLLQAADSVTGWKTFADYQVRRR